MKKLLPALLWILLLQAPLAAQSQATTADLAGVVKDQTGAVLPGVEITVENAATGLARTVASGDDGAFRVALLPPGVYRVRARLPGFVTRTVQGVVLTVGQYAQLDIHLDIAEAQGEEVVVFGDADILETRKTVQASTVREAEIDNLPINGRNFLDFTLLTPGVSDSHTLVTDKAVQTPTSGLSFGGQDQRSNAVTIDGADNMDIISNSVRATLSQEAIQEFQVNRNTFSAEFGRARGGVINIVTKSGSNDFRFNAFWFFRDQALDARNPFAFGPARSQVDPPFERHQWGATFGGPIRRSKTFFFSNYERLDRSESIFVSFLDDPGIFQLTNSQSELFDFLLASSDPDLQSLGRLMADPETGLLNTTADTFPDTLRLFENESGVFPFRAVQDTATLKLDHQFNPFNLLNTRLSWTDQFSDGEDFGALDGVSNGVSFDSRDFSTVVSYTRIFSPTRLNDFKFQFARREFEVPTNDPIGPQISLAGVAEFGREFFNPTGYRQNMYQLIENFTLLKGNHSLKTGVDFATVDLAGFAEVFLGGEFTFAELIPLAAIIDGVSGAGTTTDLVARLSRQQGRPDLVANLFDPITSVQSFNFGLPITYFQGFGDPDAAFVYNRIGLYIQDSWKVRENFTLNFGLRYETDWRPETLNVNSSQAPWQLETFAVNDRNNISPRLAFAWDPGGDGRAVLRGGYGVYYSSFFQAVAFVSQVLSGQITQIFLPLRDLFGLGATADQVWAEFQSSGQLDEDTLRAVGVDPGDSPSVILPSAADAVNPYSHQASLGYERQFGKDWAFSIDYILNRGVHLIRSRDVNVSQTGPNRFGAPLDPSYLQVNMIETSGSSVYHGLTAALNKRLRSNASFRISYTYGKAIDDTTDFITQLQANNQADLRSERSLSTFDQRHRLVVSHLFTSPWTASRSQAFLKNLLSDWTFSSINTWSSGKPFNLLTGFDLNEDTHEETDRPVLSSGRIAGRNTGLGPGFFGTDVRLSRRFRLGRPGRELEVMVEAFNLWNNTNYSGVNNVVGSSLLDSAHVQGSAAVAANQPLGFTSAFDPRQIQLGLRLTF